MKPDAYEITTILHEVQASMGPRSRRRSWPHHVFRFTDVQNAVSILEHGRIYSRERASELGLVQVDSAAPAIIRQSPWAHRYARFYFRPRTPTQYRTEGIRPPGDRWHGAHCPMPVQFLFDSIPLLCSEGCSYSSGNLARGQHTVGDDAAFLRDLPFQDIYHDSYLPGDPVRRDEIHNAKQAEVLVEDELVLDHLAAVVCRSGAERDTLLKLLTEARVALPPHLRAKIRIQRPDESLFDDDWAYVDDIRLIDDSLHVVMHVPSYRSGARDGAYRHRLSVYNHDNGEELTPTRVLPIPKEMHYQLPWDPTRVTVRYELEGCLAYFGTLSQVSVL